MSYTFNKMPPADALKASMGLYNISDKEYGVVINSSADTWT